MTAAEPVEIARLRAKLRPGAQTSSARRAAVRRQIAEWEAAQAAK